MRIYMQTPADDEKPPRYCQLIMQRDLLGGWTVIRESGNQGHAGRVKKDYFATQEQALACIEAAREVQSQKGFRVVFCEGIRQNTE